MDDDSSPWVPDKPPPNKLSDEYLQEEIKSARNGIGGFLIVGFMLGRNIQVFSRLPGTSGLYLVLAWPLAAGLCGFYLHGHAEQFGATDAIPFQWVIVIQSLIWALGLPVTLWRCTIGKRINEQEIGEGFLFRRSQRLTRWTAGVWSDIVAGAVLVGLLFAFDSPVQAKFYLVVLGWLACCHGCVLFRDLLWKARIRAAKRRANAWHEDVRGRHYL